MTDAELIAEWGEAVKERDADVQNAHGWWGEAPGIERQINIAKSDARMALWFIGRLIQRLEDKEPTP